MTSAVIIAFLAGAFFGALLVAVIAADTAQPQAQGGRRYADNARCTDALSELDRERRICRECTNPEDGHFLQANIRAAPEIQTEKEISLWQSK